MKVIKKIMAVLPIAAVSIFSWEFIGVMLHEYAPKQENEIKAMIERGQRLVELTCQSIENTVKASRASLSTTSLDEQDYGKTVIDLDDVGGISYLQILYNANIVIKDATTTEGFILDPGNAEQHMPESRFAYKITNDKVYVNMHTGSGDWVINFSYNNTKTKWVCEVCQYNNTRDNQIVIFIFEGNLTVGNEIPMLDKIEGVAATPVDGENYQSIFVSLDDFSALVYLKIDATGANGIKEINAIMDTTNKDDFVAVADLVSGIVSNAYIPDYTNRDFKEKMFLI